MSSSSDALAGAARARDWERLTGEAPLAEFAAAWLAVAGAASGAERGVLVARRPGSERFTPVAFLPEGRPCGTFLADLAERALHDARPLTIEHDGRLGIGCPVSVDGRLEAIAAFEWSDGASRSREALLRQVQWGLPWLEARLRGGAAPADPPVPRGALSRALQAAGVPDAARAAATELAHDFSCDRVSIGMATAGQVGLLAISNTAQFDVRLAFCRAIEALMTGALQASAPLRAPAAEGAGQALCLAHAGWVFCFERLAAFDEREVARAGEACGLIAAALGLQRAGAMPAHERAAAAARAAVERWLGPAAGRRRILAAAALVLVAILAFAKGEFRVAGDAALEGSVRRVISAPFDGYVASASARAGDRVKRGAPIAALDDRDLRLERVRWASQHAQYARQLQEASAKHERGQVRIVQAQLDQAAAQLELLDEQLRRARILAPFDGLVVSGDLSQSVGGAVKKGDTLFEVTPLAGYRVVIQVDETEIDVVAAGQRGQLLLAAITGGSFPVHVTAVTPVARAKDGRNAFRVEATLDAPAERLRPGMEGVAKIDTGSRNLTWIWTHRLVGWLRLRLWSLWP